MPKAEVWRIEIQQLGEDHWKHAGEYASKEEAERASKCMTVMSDIPASLIMLPRFAS
jgi:hypothetical protein